MSDTASQSLYRSIRIFLPFIVPMLLCAVGTSWIMSKGSNAYRNGECGIGLPWSTAQSLQILHDYYPAAWNEVGILQRISSSCVADLHADMVAGYFVAFVAALLSGAATLPFAALYRPQPGSMERSEFWRNIWVALMGAGVLATLVLLCLQYYEIIDFDNGRRRFSVGYHDGYTNIGGYWFTFQMLALLAIAAFWIFYVAAGHLWRIVVRSEEIFDVDG